TAQVGAISAVNSDYVTWSELKSFIVEYDPYPKYVDVNINAGTSNTSSEFFWEESKGANNYYLRIWDSTGTKEVVSVWGTDGKLSWELQLDAGEYTAQVGAISAVNSDYVTWSGLKSFIVNTSTTKPILSGDTNDDGQIDIADVVAVASYVGDSKKNPLSNEKVIAGDVHNTGDGLTANDALMIQQYISGIITKF
ncbi:MAG: dockerin type I repeat-containing protein, partial [Ruminococcus sp.]